MRPFTEVQSNRIFPGNFKEVAYILLNSSQEVGIPALTITVLTRQQEPTTRCLDAHLGLPVIIEVLTAANHPMNTSTWDFRNSAHFGGPSDSGCSPILTVEENRHFSEISSSHRPPSPLIGAWAPQCTCSPILQSTFPGNVCRRTRIRTGSPRSASRHANHNMITPWQCGSDICQPLQYSITMLHHSA